MTAGLDWSARQEPVEKRVKQERREAAGPDAPAPQRDSVEDDWETLWTDLGGEG